MHWKTTRRLMLRFMTFLGICIAAISAATAEEETILHNDLCAITKPMVTAILHPHMQRAMIAYWHR